MPLIIPISCLTSFLVSILHLTFLILNEIKSLLFLKTYFKLVQCLDPKHTYTVCWSFTFKHRLDDFWEDSEILLVCGICWTASRNYSKVVRITERKIREKNIWGARSEDCFSDESRKYCWKRGRRSRKGDCSYSRDMLETRQEFRCVIGKGHLGWLLWNCASVGLP